MKSICINNNIHYVGVNDRKKHLFENNWPLPYGVSYNSYLIKDTKSALIDTIEYGSNDNYLNNIERILEGSPLDYLIVNHMEPDHSSMIECVLCARPCTWHFTSLSELRLCVFIKILGWTCTAWASCPHLPQPHLGEGGQRGWWLK